MDHTVLSATMLAFPL